ncbi:5167_t:CDS:2 [Paraglomus brasilianum]|uniref:5167_t:CDS:1 n=1 Tax=Paraglomus brasilianum TaxID=144538 RepID=A0A9N8W570_9GLOM|nr:5167_t:CDS:2 [Paraglomus brasilianum]
MNKDKVDPIKSRPMTVLSEVDNLHTPTPLPREDFNERKKRLEAFKKKKEAEKTKSKTGKVRVPIFEPLRQQPQSGQAVRKPVVKQQVSSDDARYNNSENTNVKQSKSEHPKKGANESQKEATSVDTRSNAQPSQIPASCVTPGRSPRHLGITGKPVRLLAADTDDVQNDKSTIQKIPNSQKRFGRPVDSSIAILAPIKLDSPVTISPQRNANQSSSTSVSTQKNGVETPNTARIMTASRIPRSAESRNQDNEPDRQSSYTPTPKANRVRVIYPVTDKRQIESYTVPSPNAVCVRNPQAIAKDAVQDDIPTPQTPNRLESLARTPRSAVRIANPPSNLSTSKQPIAKDGMQNDIPTTQTPNRLDSLVCTPRSAVRITNPSANRSTSKQLIAKDGMQDDIQTTQTPNRLESVAYTPRSAMRIANPSSNLSTSKQPIAKDEMQNDIPTTQTPNRLESLAYTPRSAVRIANTSSVPSASKIFNDTHELPKSLKWLTDRIEHTPMESTPMRPQTSEMSTQTSPSLMTSLIQENSTCPDQQSEAPGPKRLRSSEKVLMDRPLIMVITDSDTGMIVNMEILVKGFDIAELSKELMNELLLIKPAANNSVQQMVDNLAHTPLATTRHFATPGPLATPSFFKDRLLPIDSGMQTPVSKTVSELQCSDRRFRESELSLVFEYESPGFERYGNEMDTREDVEDAIARLPKPRNFDAIARALEKLSSDEARLSTDTDMKEVKTEETTGSTIMVLTPVKAKRKDREELGVSTVITPVRRSARVHKRFTRDEDMESDGERQIAKLLEDNGYAYVPNPALLVEPPPKKAYRKKDVE